MQCFNSSTLCSKNKMGIAVLTFAGFSIPLTAKASIVSFGQSSQGYSVYTANGDYNSLYYGQGAVVDKGNNVWNGFGRYGGPGSTAFYGSGRTDSNVGSSIMPAGNPGNPYAYTFGSGSATGPNLFSPTNSGAANAGNATSTGAHTPVTLSLGAIDGENGAGNQGNQGKPAFILSEAELVFGSDVGTFSLGSVPTGTYNVYLYGANFDGTRGAAFTLSSGTALGGFTSTTNPNANPAGPLTSFVLGTDYVEFTGVTPTAGTISGTWSAVSNPISGLSGEGDFNGLQLVSVAAVPEPTSLGLLAIAGVGLLSRRRRC